MRVGKGLTGSLILAALIAGLAGCSPGESRVVQGNRDGVLYLGNGTEPQSLDPHVLSSSPDARIAGALHEALINYNPYDLSAEPGAAERWEFNDDRSEITFHLNPKARWSNGDPVTAEDFRWSWMRAITPEMGNLLVEVFYGIRNAQAYSKGEIDDPDAVGIRIIDPHTLRVELAFPDPFALLNFAYVYMAPVHRATIEAHGSMTDRYSAWTKPENFVGNGPFTLEEWKMQRFVKVKRNTYYWDNDNVALNAMVFRPIESATTEEKMFRSGQLHSASMVPNNKVAGYREQPDSPMVEGPYMGSYYYLLNSDRPPLDNLSVRRALALAVDRKTLASTVLQDTVLPSTNYVALGMPDYEHPQVLAFDPIEARRLLSEAGYPNGEGFPSLTLNYNTSENHRSVAVAVQQMWNKHLNIDVTLANQEWKVYLDTIDNRDYQIARMGWIGDIAPGIFLDRMVSDGPTNRSGFASAEFDNIIFNKIRPEKDQAKILALYQEAERILLEETPLIPIYSYKVKRLAQPSVKGLPSNQTDYINYKYVELDPKAPAWTWQNPES
ncbi:peptide ABC transporter substrate-binding protein [Congregibacter variabilis]|uniref:Peptide ABC transporter substrate-binding protein n=1 Tax=Congregibacter variabilis TaxID=3081200 RepID=A0ABZ0HZ88_9GAMM|nr:peptide ABC transporter substrate-binding protein [Congregibacter sp. IMCC43200]